MSDLIDRQAAIDALRNINAIVSPISDDVLLIDRAEAMAELIMLSADEICRDLKELPSAQQEIIRCKDCKHKPTRDSDGELKFPTYRCPCHCDDYYYSWMPKDDWFCANAERREE